MDSSSSAPEIPVRLPYAPGLGAAVRPMLWHSGLTLRGFYSLHILGACLPMTAAVMFQGWRAGLLMVTVVGSAGLSFLVWRRIGGRGHQMRLSHALWFALLLSLMLPSHLMTAGRPFDDTASAQWAIAVGAGTLVTVLNWLLDGAGSGRVHPVLVAYLLLVVGFKASLVPHWVLQKNHLVTGDVTQADVVELTAYPEGWRTIPPTAKLASLYETSPAEELTQFTTGQKRPDRSWFSIDGLLRDQMPPLEDLILGAQPAPVGTGSAVAVIVGGLFLLYRGVIDFRIPLLVVFTAFVAMLLLPIPAVIKEVSSGGLSSTLIDWRWLPLRDPSIGTATAFTFAGYELMAGPLLFTAFFLATAPEVRPMSRRARAVYAVLIGACAAALQLYVSVSFGPYLALLLVTLLTPLFDRFFRTRALV